MRRTTIVFAMFLLPAAWACAAQRPAKPLTQAQITGLVKGGVPSVRLVKLVERRGIGFLPTENYLASLRSAGAEEILLNALRAAHPPEPPPPSPQEIVAKDLAAAAQLAATKQWSEAEGLYRDALEKAPHDARVLFAMGQA
ncbi:MAG: hypothetical protein ACRD2O_01065, partial [Terriglobia bacterium]